jgi:hypothetical protein
MLESAGKGQPASVVAQLACSSTFRFRFYGTTAAIRIGTARNSFQLDDAQIDREFIFCQSGSGSCQKLVAQTGKQGKGFDDAGPRAGE